MPGPDVGQVAQHRMRNLDNQAIDLRQLRFPVSARVHGDEVLILDIDVLGRLFNRVEDNSLSRLSAAGSPGIAVGASLILDAGVRAPIAEGAANLYILSAGVGRQGRPTVLPRSSAFLLVDSGTVGVVTPALQKDVEKVPGRHPLYLAMDVMHRASRLSVDVLNPVAIKVYAAAKSD